MTKRRFAAMHVNESRYWIVWDRQDQVAVSTGLSQSAGRALAYEQNDRWQLITQDQLRFF